MDSQEESVIGGTYDVTDDDIKEEAERAKNYERIEVEPEYMDMKYHSRADDFDLISVIGRGGYGKVMLVRKNCGPDKDRLFAMKVVKKAVLIRNENDVRHTKAERNILENIKHPFIVELVYAFQTQHKLYLIMEYVPGGELFTHLERVGQLSEPDCRFYTSELVLALENLHQNGIVYRDLKPENILLSKSGHIKLTDFGLSKESLGNNKTHTFCGTIEYMAPEIVTRSGHGYTADWWSLGAVMYDMLSGQPPFVSTDRNRTIDLILRGRVILPTYFSSDVKDLLRKLLVRSPENRLGHGVNHGEPIKSHPFFKDVSWIDLLNRSYRPPFVPHLESDVDTSLFDQNFTSQSVADTPCDSTLSESLLNAFSGFSYVAPSVYEDRRIAEEEKNDEPHSFDDCQATLNGSWEIIDTKNDDNNRTNKRHFQFLMDDFDEFSCM